MTTLTNPLVRDHWAAILNALNLIAADRFGVGDGIAPKDVAPPYVIAYLRPGGSLSGQVAQPFEDLTLPFQVTCVAVDQTEAAWLRDEITVGLTTRPVPVPNRHALWFGTGITPAGGPGGIVRADTAKPSLFYCTPVFTFTTTP